MAKRGSKKELSVRHENAVAATYDGTRSKSSGGAVTDEGDVRVISDNTLFECKGRFGGLAGAKPVRSTLLRQFEKIADEAFSVNKEPALALRFYAPESFLADANGWVDLTVRLMDDDAQRVWELDRLRGLGCPEEGRWH